MCRIRAALKFRQVLSSPAIQRAGAKANKGRMGMSKAKSGTLFYRPQHTINHRTGVATPVVEKAHFERIIIGGESWTIVGDKGYAIRGKDVGLETTRKKAEAAAKKRADKYNYERASELAQRARRARQEYHEFVQNVRKSKS